MSRMTKFLRQSCKVEAFKADRRGNAILDDFGELMYLKPVVCRCRREANHRDIKTANGSYVRATSKYYLDESVQILPDFKVDGHVVLEVAEYTNGLGKCEGFEVYV